jgi:hypothetical protein
VPFAKKMVNSTSDAIIANPQSIITKLFGTILLSGAYELTNVDSARGEDVPSVSSDFDIPKTFEAAFADGTQFEKVRFPEFGCKLTEIPRLEGLSANELKTGKLVRFLGMVQDTSYSQEIYIGMTKSQNVCSYKLSI